MRRPFVAFLLAGAVLFSGALLSGTPFEGRPTVANRNMPILPDCPGRIGDVHFLSGAESVSGGGDIVDLHCTYHNDKRKSASIRTYYYTPPADAGRIPGPDFCWKVRGNKDPQRVGPQKISGQVWSEDHFIWVTYLGHNGFPPKKARKAATNLMRDLVGEGRVVACDAPPPDVVVQDGTEPPEGLDDTAAADDQLDADEPDAELGPAARALLEALEEWNARNLLADALREAFLETDDRAESEQLSRQFFELDAENYEHFAVDLAAIGGLTAETQALRDEIAARSREAADAWRQAIELPYDSDEELDAVERARAAEAAANDRLAELRDAVGLGFGAAARPEP